MIPPGFYKALLTWTTVSRLVVCGALISVPIFSQADESVASKNLLAQITQLNGRPLTREEAPALYGEIEPSFQRLRQAYDAIATERGQTPFPTELFIVSSTELKASITRTMQPPRNVAARPHQGVVLTTAFLEELLKKPDSNPLRADLNRSLVGVLAGVLAHEVGHPLGRSDTNWSEHRWGSFGGQADEMATDSVALEILDRAKLPRDSLYEALKRLYTPAWNKFRKSKQGLNAAFTAHPQADLRLSALRLQLTAARQRQGAPIKDVKAPVSPPFLEELKRLQGDFKPPSDLNECLTRLLTVLADGIRLEFKYSPSSSLEFNRLLIVFNHFLAQDHVTMAGLTPELSKLFQAFHFLMGHPGMKIPTLWTRFEEFKNDKALAGFGTISYREAVQTEPVYQSPEHLKWFDEALRPLYGDSAWISPDFSSSLNRVLPDTIILQKWRPQIEQAFRENPLRALERLPYTASIPAWAEILEDFHKREYPKLTPRQKAALFLNLSPDGPLFPKELPNSKQRTQNRKFWFGSEGAEAWVSGDPLASLQHSIAEELWSERGRYGVLDAIMLGNGVRTDWKEVFRRLKIEPAEGYAKIRQAVKEFTGSAAYPALAEELFNASEFQKSVLPASNSFLTPGKPQWADRSSWKDLARPWQISSEKADQSWQWVARHFAGESLITADGNHLRQEYAKILERKLASHIQSGHLSTSDFIASENETNTELFGWTVRQLKTPTYDLWARIIDRSPLSAENKRELLRDLLANPTSEVVNALHVYTASWAQATPDDAVGKISRTFLKYGVHADLLELFEKALKEQSRPDKTVHFGGFPQQNPTAFYNTVTRFEEPALSQMKAAGTIVDFRRMTNIFLHPYPGYPYGSNSRLSTSRAMTRLKATAVEGLRRLQPSAAERLELFRKITATGGTPATDRYFDDFILESSFRIMEKPESGPITSLRENQHSIMTRLLTEGNLDSPETRIKLARRLMADRQTQIALQGDTKYSGVKYLAQEIDKLVPGKSLERDGFLEELAWNLRLESLEDLKLLEQLKTTSTHPDAKDGKFVPMLSTFAEEIKTFSLVERKAAIEYLMKKHPGQLPPLLETAVDRSVAARINAKNLGLSTTEQALPDATFQSKLRLERIANDLNPVEKVAALELFLNSGEKPLSQESGFPYNIIRQFLGYAPDSREEKMLAAYLRIADEYERSVVLAYLMSLPDKRKGGVKSIFEAFRTIGIKAGQTASIWKVFGDGAATRELATLKDQAPPMTKLELREALERSLTTDELHGPTGQRTIRIRKVLGSASVKTVALLEIIDPGQAPREAVALVRGPNAIPQIQDNLARGKLFMAELEKEGMRAESALIKPLLAGLEAQILDEIDLRREAGKLKQATELYANLNHELAGELEGWRFRVPAVLEGFEPKEDLLLVERASGVSFDLLKDGTLKPRLGRNIVRASLLALFKHGLFDPDRHTRNFLLNQKMKDIWVYDLGQQETLKNGAGAFKSTDTYLIAQFVRALEGRDAELLAQQGIAMAELPTPLSRTARRLLVQDLEAVLKAKAGFGDLLSSVVAVFAKADLQLQPRFIFAAFKGLMTLQGENYVRPEEFAQLMKDQVSLKLREKGALLVREEIGLRVPEMARKCAEAFRRFSGGALLSR